MDLRVYRVERALARSVLLVRFRFSQPCPRDRRASRRVCRRDRSRRPRRRRWWSAASSGGNSFAVACRRGLCRRPAVEHRRRPGGDRCGAAAQDGIRPSCRRRPFRRSSDRRQHRHRVRHARPGSRLQRAPRRALPRRRVGQWRGPGRAAEQVRRVRHARTNGSTSWGTRGWASRFTRSVRCARTVWMPSGTTSARASR